MSDLEQSIRKTVDAYGDPLMEHIISGVRADYDGEFPDLQIRNCVLTMVKRGVLRMKEDPIDHDWAYRKGSNW